jgi:hypothetical protein
VATVSGLAALDVVMTANGFIQFVTPEVLVEAQFTEANNETRSLADYLTDLQTRIERILADELEITVQVNPTYGEPYYGSH